MQSISSLRVALTGEQISALNRCIDEFQAVDYEDCKEIVEEFFGSFKRACPRGVIFDGVTIKTVCAPLEALG
jgi:hypothetical protein